VHYFRTCQEKRAAEIERLKLVLTSAFPKGVPWQNDPFIAQHAGFRGMFLVPDISNVLPVTSPPGVSATL